MSETRNVRLITKRTSVPGKIPTGTTGDESGFIKTGELASNLSDHSLWGYDGANVFEYGTNSFLGLTGGTVSGNTEFIGSLQASAISATSINSEIISGGTIYGDGSNIKNISGAFGITIDGNGSVLTPGQKGFFMVPYNFGIIGWDMVANLSGNCVVDIWKNTSFPTAIDSITGTQKPTLNGSQIQSNSSSLNTWTTGATSGEVIVFSLISATTISKLTLSVRTVKK